MAHRYAYVVIILLSALSLVGAFRFSDDAQAYEPISINISAPSGSISAQVPATTLTVGDALLRLAIQSDATLISPPLSATLTQNVTITLTPTRSIVLHDGVAEPREITSAATTVGDALVTAGVTLTAPDRVSPNLSSALVDGMDVSITRIEEVERTVTIVVPYATTVTDDAVMLWGSEEIVSTGRNGVAEEDVRLRIVNGEISTKSVLDYRLIKEPVTAEVRRGIRIIIDEIYEGNSSWYAYRGCDCAASAKYPRGTWLRATNLLNGKQVIVKTNDWGPDPAVFPERIIDLDAVAFKKLSPLWKGVIPVRVEKLRTE